MPQPNLILSDTHERGFELKIAAELALVAAVGGFFPTFVLANEASTAEVEIHAAPAGEETVAPSFQPAPVMVQTPPKEVPGDKRSLASSPDPDSGVEGPSKKMQKFLKGAGRKLRAKEPKIKAP